MRGCESGCRRLPRSSRRRAQARVRRPQPLLPRLPLPLHRPPWRPRVENMRRCPALSTPAVAWRSLRGVGPWRRGSTHGWLPRGRMPEPWMGQPGPTANTKTTKPDRRLRLSREEVSSSSPEILRRRGLQARSPTPPRAVAERCLGPPPLQQRQQQWCPFLHRHQQRRQVHEEEGASHT
jgi:hypothetical protein